MRWWKLAAGLSGALAVAVGVINVTRDGASSNPAPPGLPSATQEISKALLPFHASPRPLPPIRFTDGRGRTLSLADFRGKTVLLNVWATWCPPCREEMPALDRLKEKLGGTGFEVVAISVDQGQQGLFLVEEFYTQSGIKSLGVHMDSFGEASRDLSVVGLPTTLLIDRSGNEVSRVIGPREWDSPEMVAAIRSRLATTADPAAAGRPRG
ncbi:MAG: TlpA family protein disulfide reductase [Betaproteobacteria bacterium]|nr:TlpA family protein disulfide reductase [Betaproteobacteria bacterium]